MRLKTNNDIDSALIGRNIQRVGDYINAVTNILFKCLICSNEWLAAPNNITSNKRGCPKCGFAHVSSLKRLTNDIIDKKLESRTVKRLGNYVNARTKILFSCLLCSRQWKTTPDNVLQGHGCKSCEYSGGAKLIDQSVIESRIGDRKIKMIGSYSGANKKILFGCLICDSEWMATPSSVLSRLTGCPICKESKGEKEISRILTSLGVVFNKQQLFSGCKSVYTLRFDFYLPDYNMCVEFDGIHHYKVIQYNNDDEISESRFKGIKLRDAIKTEYCRTNGIKLLRIPYWELKNVEQILRKCFNVCKSEP